MLAAEMQSGVLHCVELLYDQGTVRTGWRPGRGGRFVLAVLVLVTSNSNDGSGEMMHCVHKQ